MAKILNGRIVRDQTIIRLKKKVRNFGYKPTLAIVQVGDLKESGSYIKQKKIFAEKIGAEVRHFQFSQKVAQLELLAKIKELNLDASVNGIIVQLPIPKTLDSQALIEAVDPAKDVDGLNSRTSFVPATAKGILALLDFYKIKLAGQHVLVIGRSKLVGKPTALALLSRDATVTIAHSQTKKLKVLARAADILVVAIGKPKLINASYVRKGQVVIDVGINLKGKSFKEEITNQSGQSRFVGDVDFDKVKGIVKAVSPVPGGVGAMTVAALFENLIQASR